jgi:hypothetical protein
LEGIWRAVTKRPGAQGHGAEFIYTDQSEFGSEAEPDAAADLEAVAASEIVYLVGNILEIRLEIDRITKSLQSAVGGEEI